MIVCMDMFVCVCLCVLFDSVFMYKMVSSGPFVLVYIHVCAHVYKYVCVHGHVCVYDFACCLTACSCTKWCPVVMYKMLFNGPGGHT